MADVDQAFEACSLQSVLLVYDFVAAEFVNTTGEQYVHVAAGKRYQVKPGVKGFVGSG